MQREGKPGDCLDGSVQSASVGREGALRGLRQRRIRPLMCPSAPLMCDNVQMRRQIRRGLPGPVRGSQDRQWTTQEPCNTGRVRLHGPGATGRLGAVRIQPSPTRATMENNEFMVEMAQAFQRRMAAIVDAVQARVWQAGVHALLGSVPTMDLGNSGRADPGPDYGPPVSLRPPSLGHHPWRCDGGPTTRRWRHRQRHQRIDLTRSARRHTCCDEMYATAQTTAGHAAKLMC